MSDAASISHTTDVYSSLYDRRLVAREQKMPENTLSSCQSEAAIIAHGLPSKKQQRIDANWLRLPYELWLTVLVDYGVSAADLVCLEYSAKWFSNGWGGMLICASLEFPP